MELAVQQVCRRVSHVAIGETILAGSDNNAHLNGRVGGFHLLEIVRRADGISVSIVWFIVSIRLPGAIAFVPDLPILKSVVVGYVGMTHPTGGLGRSAAPIIHGDEGLGANVSGDVNEIREGGSPGPGIGSRLVRTPMVFIGKGAARKAQDGRAGFLEKRDRSRSIEVRIPNGGVEAEPPKVDR